MATPSTSSKVETLITSDPFPAFVWADTERQARRLVTAHPRFAGYDANQLRARKTLTNRFGNRHRYAIWGPKRKYNLDAALAEFRKNPTKHRDARKAREAASQRKETN